MKLAPTLLLALHAAWLAPPASTVVESSCLGCTAEGGGTSLDSDSNATDEIWLQVAATISNGVCIIEDELAGSCAADSGCPITLEASYWSTEPVTIELTPGISNPRYKTTLPATNAWTEVGSHSTSRSCSGFGLDYTAFLYDATLTLHANIQGALVCGTCPAAGS